MISRRNFLKASFAIAASYPLRSVFAYTNTDRSLHLYNIHTQERLAIEYCASGIYDSDAINKINYLMRCHYTNQVVSMDVKLLDLLCDIKDTVGRNKEIHIISGYRSHAYNEYLRSIGRKVVKNSLHLYGLAIDFLIPGVSFDELSKIAKSFSAGGVGKYSEFVHIDVGRVRYW